MTKDKFSILHKVKQWFIYHPWIKIIALLLAIIVWFYAKDEIGRFKY